MISCGKKRLYLALGSQDNLVNLSISLQFSSSPSLLWAIWFSQESSSDVSNFLINSLIINIYELWLLQRECRGYGLFLFSACDNLLKFKVISICNIYTLKKLKGKMLYCLNYVLLSRSYNLTSVKCVFISCKLLHPFHSLSIFLFLPCLSNMYNELGTKWRKFSVIVILLLYYQQFFFLFRSLLHGNNNKNQSKIKTNKTDDCSLFCWFLFFLFLKKIVTYQFYLCFAISARSLCYVHFLLLITHSKIELLITRLIMLPLHIIFLFVFTFY